MPARVAGNPQVRGEPRTPEGRAQIAKHGPRFDRRQLVGISQENEARLARHRPHEALHHREVDHRSLVDDDDAMRQRIVLVTPEPSSGGRPYEEPVKRLWHGRVGPKSGVCNVARA